MSLIFDCIIIGAGIMGSASAFYLTQAGQKVLLLDQYELDHSLGSSHGDSRIIRKSYPQQHFSALMKDAYTLWEELETKHHCSLIEKTGGLDFGPEGSPDLALVEQACKSENILYTKLNSQEISQKFPPFLLPENYYGIYQEEAGIVKASKSLSFFQVKAIEGGLVVKTGEKVTSIKYNTQVVTVCTDEEYEYKTFRLVIAPGLWINDFFKLLHIDRRIEIYHVGYSFWKVEESHKTLFYRENFPVFICYDEKIYYGFPQFEKEGHVKIAPHFAFNVSNHGKIFTEIDPQLLESTKNFISARIKYIEPIPVYPKVCYYSMTSDENFILDFHPQAPNILFVGGFSGHGFKFAPLIGSIVRDLVLTGKTAKQELLTNFKI